MGFIILVGKTIKPSWQTFFTWRPYFALDDQQTGAVRRSLQLYQEATTVSCYCWKHCVFIRVSLVVIDLLNIWAEKHARTLTAHHGKQVNKP